MYKALIGIAALGAIAVTIGLASANDQQTSERERCAAVLVDWVKGATSDNKMTFCQVEGLVSEDDMKQALNSSN